MADPIRLSNSKAKTWRRCPKQFEFKYVKKLRPRRKGRALELGSWVHDLLMHYRDDENWLRRHGKLKAEFNALFEEEREELGDLPDQALRLMRSYISTYAAEDKQRWRTIDTEVDQMVTLPNGDTFQVIIDLIVEDVINGGQFIWDYKSVSKFMPPEFQQLDTQLTRYFWAAKKLGYENLQGVVFDEIRTKAPTVPELLQSGRLTEKKSQDTDVATYLWAMKHRDEFKDESWEEKVKFYRATLRRIQAQEQGRFFRRTMLPKDPPTTRAHMLELIMTSREIKRAQRTNEFPRTVDKSCVWQCDYLDICTLDLMGADITDTVKMKYRIHKKEED